MAPRCGGDTFDHAPPKHRVNVAGRHGPSPRLRFGLIVDKKFFPMDLSCGGWAPISTGATYSGAEFFLSRRLALPQMPVRGPKEDCRGAYREDMGLHFISVLLKRSPV